MCFRLKICNYGHKLCRFSKKKNGCAYIQKFALLNLAFCTSHHPRIPQAGPAAIQQYIQYIQVQQSIQVQQFS
jgi:hypothetical protein